MVRKDFEEKEGLKMRVENVTSNVNNRSSADSLLSTFCVGRQH